MQITAPAALRFPEDTKTVIQREEQRAAEDAIIPSLGATHCACPCDGGGVTGDEQRRFGEVKSVTSKLEVCDTAKIGVNMISCPYRASMADFNTTSFNILKKLVELNQE